MKQGKGFFSAISAYFTALGMIFKSKRFASYLFLPFVMNIFLFCSVFYLAFVYVMPQMVHFLDAVIASLPQHLTNSMPVFSVNHPTIFGIISTIAVSLSYAGAFIGKILFVIVVIMFVYFTYSIVGSILAAPFLDLISLRAEQILSGGKLSLPSIGFFKSIYRAIINAVKLLIFLLLVNAVLLLLNLIPVVGSVLYTIFNYLIMFFMIGFNFLDFPFERRQMSFRQKLRTSFSFFSMTVGLGVVFVLTSSIIIFGFLSLPLCAAAAGVLHNRVVEPNLPALRK